MKTKILRSELITKFHSDVSFSPEGDLIIGSESLPVEILTKIRKGRPVLLLFVCPDDAEPDKENGQPNMKGCKEREVVPAERDPNMRGCLEGGA